MNTPTIGHNSGAVPTPAIIAETLAETQADLAKRQAEILAGLDRMPAEILDEETNGKATDFVKSIQAFVKIAESRRTDIKQPYLDGGKAVDGHFKKLMEAVAKAKLEVERRMTVFARAKAERERRAREALLEAQRQAEQAAREEAERRAQAVTDAKTLNVAIGAEKAVETAAGDVAKAAAAMAAPAADLSRTRGDLGGVSSLITFWTFRDLDREKLDLEALRAHIPADALESAMRSFIKAGGREIAGAHIFEDTKIGVR